MTNNGADFAQDKRYTNDARKLLDRDLYPRLSYQGRWVVIAGSDGCHHLQTKAHIDVVVQTGAELSITIEEKIARQKYEYFAVETHGDTRAESPNGWIYTSTADYLIYAFTVQGGLEAHMMHLPDLRRFFDATRQRYRTVDKLNRWGTHEYTSRVALVPVAKVRSTLYRLRW